MEWNCLDEDTHKALRSKTYKGSLKKCPNMSRIDLEDLREMIEEAEQDMKKIHVIIASCPAQIGDDPTIMDQVYKMAEGQIATTPCFSYAGNAASQVRDEDDNED